MADGVKPASTNPPPPEVDQTNLKLELVGVAALVTPLFAAIGGLAATGVIGRVQRNHPVLLSVGLGLVMSAGALWLIAGLSTARLVALRVVACVAAVGGFVVGLVAAVETANDQPRPQVAASLSPDAQALDVHVEASSLETDDRLAIFVDMVNDGRAERLAYRAYQGPDADGIVDHEVTVALPTPRRFDAVGVMAFTDNRAPACDDRAAVPEGGDEKVSIESGTGCVTVALAKRPAVPSPEVAPPETATEKASSE